MAASCPAVECGFSGPVEAVCGHLGGSSDSIHEGFGADDLASEGVSEEFPAFSWVLLAGAVLIGAYLLSEGAEAGKSGSSETALIDGEQETTENAPSEGGLDGATEVPLR